MGHSLWFPTSVIKDLCVIWYHLCCAYLVPNRGGTCPIVSYCPPKTVKTNPIDIHNSTRKCSSRHSFIFIWQYVINILIYEPVGMRMFFQTVRKYEWHIFSYDNICMRHSFILFYYVVLLSYALHTNLYVIVLGIVFIRNWCTVYYHLFVYDECQVKYCSELLWNVLGKCHCMHELYADLDGVNE